METSTSATPVVTVYGGAVYDSETVNNGSVELEEFLNAALGPQQVTLNWLIPVTIFYVLVFITGLVGNIAVCVVIIKNKSLHSAMNYYLISLALADLIIIIMGKEKCWFRNCVL